MQGWELSDLHPVSRKTPAPQYQPIDRKKKNWKIVENKRDRAAKATKKSIGPSLETRQSHTIEYRVIKIVSQGHWKRNKCPGVLRGSAASNLISIPMWDKRTAFNPHWHIRQVRDNKEGASGHAWSYTALHSTATDRRWAMSHSNLPPVRKRAPLTTRQSNIRFVSAAEHHTAEQ